MCFIFLILVSCGQKGTAPDSTSAPDEAPAETAPTEAVTDIVIPEISDVTWNDFDASLIEYLCENGYYYKEFIVSPAAFRASLCLAAAGAEGNTRTELINAAGFSGTDEMNLWYMSYRNAAAGYIGDSGRTAAPLYTACSVWNDPALMGDFTAAFQTSVQEKYDAGAYVAGNDAMTEDLDGWLTGQTDGILTSFQKDISGAADALVSAMYLEVLWAGDFHKPVNQSKDGPELMEQTGKFLYADESGTQIVVLPMKGELYFVCFQGNRTDRLDKLSGLQPETVHVVLPEFEMCTALDADDLLNFSIARGVREALNGATANFSPMCGDTEWFLQELLQAAKLSVKAPEAAAGTGNTEKTIKEFTADGAFSFAVISGFGTERQQVLLYGQKMAAGVE